MEANREKSPLVQPVELPFDIGQVQALAGKGDQLHPHRARDPVHQDLPLAHSVVDRGEDSGLQGILPKRGGVMTVLRTVVHPAGAVPRSEFLSPLRPHAPAVEGAALAAHQPLCEGVLGAVAGAARGSQLLARGPTRVPPGELRLDGVEGVPADDTLVIVLLQAHGELSHIADLLFGDAVLSESLLRITDSDQVFPP